MKGKWRLEILLPLAVSAAHEILALSYRGRGIINPGVSFGFSFLGITGLTIILLGVVAYWALRDKEMGWWLVFSGGLANLLDRLRFGGVRDYWQIPLTNVYNNIGDVIIFVGLLFLLWKKSK